MIDPSNFPQFVSKVGRVISMLNDRCSVWNTSQTPGHGFHLTGTLGICPY